MFLPLGTDRPRRRPTLANNLLIGASLLAFLAQTVAMRVAPDAAARFFDPFVLDPRAPTLWAFFTYQFLHGGFLHLVGNMLFLYVFGPNVEDRFGRIGYLAFYLVGGAVAGGAHALIEPNPVIGASGAIAAVTGAFLVLFPKTHVRMLMFFFIIGVYDIPATWFIGFAIAKDLFFQGLGAADGVARLAHIGGYAYGIAIALTLLATGLLPREPFDLFSLGRQARRRRAFKELTSRGSDPWRGQTGERRGRVVAHAKPVDPRQEALGAARAEVSRLHATGEIDQAAEAYRRLLDAYGPVAMSRRAQIDIANHLFQESAHRPAATAYSLFLDRHERDAEAPHVRLMLGLLYARYLNEPERARDVLDRARETLHDPDHRDLARSLLEELG